MLLPAGYLMADASGMVLDTSCGGTTLVSGTTFIFGTIGSGSTDCHTNTNLVFGNVSPAPWLNLLLTATIPSGLTGSLTCDPGADFLHCTASFDPNAHVYNAFFFGEDTSHPGIQISTFTGNGRTNEFGFTYSGFPLNQQFNAAANVPEPSSLALMLAAIALLLGAIFIRARCASAFRRTALISAASPR